MKSRHLPYLLVAAGLVLIGLAVRAWYHFYGMIAADMHLSLEGAWHCLYSVPTACRFGQGVTDFKGAEIYEPWMFWLGMALTTTGALTSLILLAVRR